MRRKILISLLLLTLFCGVIYWAYVGTTASRVDEAAQALACRVPVPNNRGPEVLDGFRGEVHPLLRRSAEMEVKAYWNCEKINIDALLPGLPADLDVVRRLYMALSVDVHAKSYSERDFSGFLPPENVSTTGHLWALDPETSAVFLKQFQPDVSVRSASVGRRPGPDGAFAVLQGVSASYLDIVFRVHAEFDLVPKSTNLRARNAWYTPASFLGRIVVNRNAGTVEYFQLGVPTDIVKNIHGTVLTAPTNEHPQGFRVYQFLRADRMELIGGSLQGLEDVHWGDKIETAQAHDKLTKVFYKFKEINFLPFHQALAIARTQKKPIFAVVALGALDDQSC